MAQVYNLGYILPMKTIYKLLLVTLLLLSTTHAETWRVNWQHSKVTFQIPYMGITDVSGAFTKFDGAFDFNEATKKLDNVEFVIETKSVDTNNTKRDAHIRKEDFFYTNKYPRIRFVSTNTVYKDYKPVKLIGNLELLDTKKEVTFDIKYKGSVQDPWDQNKIAQFFEASTVINRKDFGLSWNKKLDKGGLLLGESVKIDIIIEAFEQGVRPAFSRFYLPTKNIKKSVAKEITDKKKVVNESTPINETTAGNVVAPSVVSTPELPKVKDIVLNIVFGFIAFVILIGGGIKLQIVITKFLEKKNFDPKWTFLIPNIIVMILIMYIATLLAPYMGYGPHPWGN